MRVLQPYGKKLFEEEQPFRKSWTWWVVIITAILPLILITVIVLADKGITPREKAITFAIAIGANLINLTVFYYVQLETVITDKAVFYRWRPFRRKYHVVVLADIKSAVPKQFPSVRTAYTKLKWAGKAHVVSGKDGIQLTLHNNQLIFLGTQRLTAIKYVLNTIKSNSSE